MEVLQTDIIPQADDHGIGPQIEDNTQGNRGGRRREEGGAGWRVHAGLTKAAGGTSQATQPVGAEGLTALPTPARIPAPTPVRR